LYHKYLFFIPNFVNLSSCPKKIFSTTVSPDRVPSSYTIIEIPSLFAST
jgi:hypothetical protein